MASIAQFETALLDKKVEIDEIKSKGKDVTKAFGYIHNQKYYWLGSGVCFSSLGVRKPLLDLKF